MIELKGKTAVITGAGQGLGRAIAAHLAQCGMRVALIGRTGAKVKRVADEIGGNALPIEADVSDPDSVAAAFARIGEAFGTLDVLVNNAAIIDTLAFADASLARIQGTVGTNLMGPIYCTHAAIPLMRKAGRGDVINVTSEGATNPAPLIAVYSATKAGLEALTRSLVMEHEAEDIRFTILRLGVQRGVTPTPEVQQLVDACLKSGTGWLVNKLGAPPERAAAMVELICAMPRDAIVNVAEVRATS